MYKLCLKVPSAASQMVTFAGSGGGCKCLWRRHVSYLVLGKWPQNITIGRHVRSRCVVLNSSTRNRRRRTAYLREFCHKFSEATGCRNFADDTGTVGLAFLVFDFPLDGKGVVAIACGKNCVETPGAASRGVPCSPGQLSIMLPQPTWQTVCHPDIRFVRLHRGLQDIHKCLLVAFHVALALFVGFGGFRTMFLGFPGFFKFLDHRRL